MQENEVFNHLTKIMDRGQFIVKNASIPMFPDTPEKENRKIYEMRANRYTAEPMFQIGRDRTMMGRRKPITIFKEGKDSFREGTTQEEMLGIIFSPTAKNTPARALFAMMLELFLG